MSYKNAKYNAHGTIDCEIDHPQHGWIKTTLSAEDPETADMFTEVSAGDVAPGPTLDQQAQQAIEAWRASTIVSAFQAHQALDDFELIDQVEALMDDPDTPKKTRRAWQMATEFRRLSPTVLELAGVLELTDEQVDELFRHALTIEA